MTLLAWIWVLAVVAALCWIIYRNWDWEFVWELFVSIAIPLLFLGAGFLTIWAVVRVIDSLQSGELSPFSLSP